MFGLFSKSEKVPDQFTVFETGPDGDTRYDLKVGIDIDADTASNLHKIAVGNSVYAVHVYKDGVKQKKFVPKDLYQKVKSAMDSIG